MSVSVEKTLNKIDFWV